MHRNIVLQSYRLILSGHSIDGIIISKGYVDGGPSYKLFVKGSYEVIGGSNGFWEPMFNLRYW